MQIYKIDDDGFFEEIRHVEENEEGVLDVDYNYTEVKPENGFYKPKFVNGEWVEGITSEELQEIEQNALNDISSTELKEAENDLKLIQKLIEWGVL